MIKMTNYPVTLADGYKANFKLATFVYDFAVNGGAVGTLILDPDTIPAGFYVKQISMIVETTFTSGGAATVAFGSNANDDLIAPWAFGAFTANTALNTVPETSPKKTSAGGLRMTIAGAALTAGKAKILVELERLAA